MVYESWETTWEKIKRQDAEAAEAAKAIRIKEREYERERAVVQQQREYYLQTAATQSSLEKRIAQMRMKSGQRPAVEASVSVKTKEVLPDAETAAQVKDFHSQVYTLCLCSSFPQCDCLLKPIHNQDPLVIFFDDKAKTRSLADRLQASVLVWTGTPAGSVVVDDQERI